MCNMTNAKEEQTAGNDFIIHMRKQHKKNTKPPCPHPNPTHLSRGTLPPFSAAAESILACEVS